MESLISSARKALKKTQEDEAKNYIQHSRAKVKFIDEQAEQVQLKNEEILTHQKVIQNMNDFPAIDDFLRSKNIHLISHISRVPKDQFDQKFESFFQTLNQKHQNLIELNPQDHPFYYPQFGFFEYLKQEVQSLYQIGQKMGKYHIEAEKIFKIKQRQNNLHDFSKFQNIYKINLSKNNTLLMSSKLTLKNQIQKQTKKEQEIMVFRKKIYLLLKIIQDLQHQNEDQNFSLKEKNEEYQNLYGFGQKTKKKLISDKFQTSIIKLQTTNTLFRYGSKIVRSDISKSDYLLKKCYKFEWRVKPIQILDLRVFIMSALYPMAASIFNDFSSQCNVYKAMFGRDMLSDQESEMSLMVLTKRVEKYLQQKKYHSVEECINSTIKLRKKKIIFIGSKVRFDQVMGQVISQITGYSNKLLEIISVQIQQVSKSYEGSYFWHYQLQINYRYSKISVNVGFDVLFSLPGMALKQQIQLLRKKSQKFQQVLVWFQIPKADLEEERILCYKEINSMFMKTDLFYLPSG